MADPRIEKLQKELAATQKSLAALTEHQNKKKRKRSTTEVVQTLSEGVKGIFKKNCAKGRFGFAETEDGREIFVIPSGCVNNALPKVGEEITFSVVVGEDGKQRADEVRSKDAQFVSEEICSSEGEQATEDPYGATPAVTPSSSSGQPCPPPTPMWPWTQTKIERIAELLQVSVEEMHRIFDTMELVDVEFKRWLPVVRAARAQIVSQIASNQRGSSSV